MTGDQLSNSVRAGAFVLTAIALAAAVGFVLLRSDPFRKRNEFQVRFSLEDGVAGLAQGSDVQVGGLTRGRVLEVTPSIDAETGNVQDILVHFEIDLGITFYSRTSPTNAPDDGVRVIRVASPLGNTASLNFISVGLPKLDGSDHAINVIKPDSTIDATSGSGLLASIVGAENAAQVGAILRNVANFSASLDEEGAPMLANARSVVGRVSTDYETWRKNISGALENADQSLVRMNGYLAPKAQVEVFLDDAVGVAEAAKDVMVEARDTAMPKVEKILDTAIASANSLEQTLGEVQAEFTAQVPTIRGFLFNAREAATQLKLGTLEVRRNPWRIFSKPGPDAIANENLYQAAADFAMATSDLNVATESLRAVITDDRTRFTQDAAFRKQVEDQVLRSVDRFEQARLKLGEILHAAPSSPRAAP